MVAITFNIDKQKVLGEVGKTTAYVGAHAAEGDAVNYENISTTDENSEMLERFWTESEAAVCDAFKGYIKDTEEGREDRFSVTLILSETFQPHLRYSIEDSLFSFFVLNITAKWFGITNKQEVEGYGAAAKDALDGARDMALYKEHRSVRHTNKQNRDMENEVSITLEVRELLHDIRNKTYLTKKARGAAGLSVEAASDMQADESSADKYQLGRTLMRAFEGAKHVVSEYLKEEEGSGTDKMRKEIDDEGQLTLDLMMPGNFDKNAVGLLTESVHAYMVTTALAEWFMVKSPNEAQYYIKEILGCINAVRVAIYKRNRPERPNCEY